MKSQCLKLNSDINNSFNFRVDQYPTVNSFRHYHQEFELVYFKKGHGTQFIGDSVMPFYEGNIVLLGPNLEHYWKFDDGFFSQAGDPSVEVYVIHFDKIRLEHSIFELPECNEIKKVLELSSLGIEISNAEKKITHLLPRLAKAKCYERLGILVNVLGIIADSKNKRSIATAGFVNVASWHADLRIQKIFDYLQHNISRSVGLHHIANIAGMNPSAFCRYFKANTNKTFADYFNEMKVGYACQLIRKGAWTMKQVSYEVGFKNLTSFHKIFKKYKGETPLQYKRTLQGLKPGNLPKNN